MRTLEYWEDRVYVGTENTVEGCEVWRGDRHPIFEQGFENGAATGWSTVSP
jgi:hypothetical protein